MTTRKDNAMPKVKRPSWKNARRKKLPDPMFPKITHEKKTVRSRREFIHEVGFALRKFRCLKRMQVQVLAAKANCFYKTINSIETGNPDGSSDEMLKRLFFCLGYEYLPSRGFKIRKYGRTKYEFMLEDDLVPETFQVIAERENYAVPIDEE